jgi:GNAT superfamily N-acetyltransferase
MPEVIDDVSSVAVFAAQEANMAAFWLAYGRAPGCSVSSDPNVAWFFTGIPYPLFNGVARAILQPDTVQPVVDILSGHIKNSGAPALWWVGPQSRPDDLGKMLERAGLQPIGDAPAMAIDLKSLGGEPSSIARFSVERVRNAEMQALWARTAAVGTEAPQSAVEALTALEAKISDEGYRAQRRYVGFLDGAPVATSALVLEAGVAGIYAVATHPAARGKGIGRLMTVAPLLEARASGYRVGILQSSSMGYPIYKKIGFADVGAYRLYLQAS